MAFSSLLFFFEWLSCTVTQRLPRSERCANRSSAYFLWATHLRRLLLDASDLEFWLGSSGALAQRRHNTECIFDIYSKERLPVSVRVQVRQPDLERCSPSMKEIVTSVGCVEAMETHKKDKRTCTLILFGLNREIIGRQRVFFFIQEKGRFSFCFLFDTVSLP